MFNSISRILIFTFIGIFSATAFPESKKIVFLADKGKDQEKHAHESGNALLAKALEESGMGFETSQFKGWPGDLDALKELTALLSTVTVAMGTLSCSISISSKSWSTKALASSSCITQSKFPKVVQVT